MEYVFLSSTCEISALVIQTVLDLWKLTICNWLITITRSEVIFGALCSKLCHEWRLVEKYERDFAI